VAKELVYNNSAEVFGVYIAQFGMFLFDISVVLAAFIVGLILKDSIYRYPLWTCAGIYLTFALIWHLI